MRIGASPVHSLSVPIPHPPSTFNSPSSPLPLPTASRQTLTTSSTLPPTVPPPNLVRPCPQALLPSDQSIAFATPSACAATLSQSRGASTTAPRTASCFISSDGYSDDIDDHHNRPAKARFRIIPDLARLMDPSSV
eukprot:466455-Pleurochrysis_carterae.AAC.2